MDATRRVKFSDENNENNSAYVNSILFDDNKVFEKIYSLIYNFTFCIGCCDGCKS